MLFLIGNSRMAFMVDIFEKKIHATIFQRGQKLVYIVATI